MSLLSLRIERVDPLTLQLQLPQFGTLRLPLANCFLTLGAVSQDTEPLALQVHLFVPGMLDLGPLYAPQMAALQSFGVP